LWAEAARAETAGEAVLLDESLWSVAGEEQEKRRAIDPWEDILANIPETAIERDENGERKLDNKRNPIVRYIVHQHGVEERVATQDLLRYVINLEPSQQTPHHAQKVAVIMKRLGWEQIDNPVSIGGKKARGYRRRTRVA